LRYIAPTEEFIPKDLEIIEQFERKFDTVNVQEDEKIASIKQEQKDIK
jgi:hypothetical protein